MRARETALQVVTVTETASARVRARRVLGVLGVFAVCEPPRMLPIVLADMPGPFLVGSSRYGSALGSLDGANERPRGICDARGKTDELAFITVLASANWCARRSLVFIDTV